MTTAGNHYTVLARRFRPQAFDDVVGQEHVARALTNAIKAGRVAHAYMFTGARGVGKTSTARILAKALNCPNVVEGVPCNSCEICDGISSGNDVDVMEIDGASNRGIDDIRALRANVGVRSMRTPFKVYIIDEVHALSKDAFNALLKTLEEPPPNVKFVFCTTEPNKVPDTILSRCQRFDFSSIADGSIADRLRDIAKVEGFDVSEDALELVARRARGSMRDSQSLFDQLLAFSTGQVAADDVHRMLGTAGDERLVELFQAIVEHRPGEVLAQLDGAFGAGVQSGELMDQLIGYVRDLMVTLAAGPNVALSSVAGRHQPILQQQASRMSMPSVMAAFQILANGRTQMFRSTFARTILEMAVVQVCLLENLSAISDLLSGRLPALPDASSASTTVVPPSVNSDAEKKNSELKLTDNGRIRDAEPGQVRDDQIETAPSPEIAASAPAIPASPSIELTNANCPQLLQALLSTKGAKFPANLRQAEALRMAGPGRLEIVMRGGSDFARRMLDQSEHREAIEAEIKRLTGQTVGVSFIANPIPEEREPPRIPSPVATERAAPRIATAPQTATAIPARDLKGVVDPNRDPFVKQVMDVFGGTVVRVTAAPVSVAADAAED